MAERNSRNRVFATPWMPLGPFSKTHFMVATDIASALVEETALQLPFTYLPAVFLRVCAAEHHGRQKWEAGVRLTTSDILRGNTSYFLWIALSFISLQINLVTVGDSPAATAGPFRAACEVRVGGSLFLS